MEYRHTQSSYLVVFVAIFFVLLFGVIATQPDSGAALIITGLAMVMILIVVFAFSRLTVTVDAENVAAAFGWGWPKRTIALTDISGLRQVRNRWFYGWGLRWVPHGTMFNVWGLDAVELRLGTGRAFRIGTDEPVELLATLAFRTSLRPDPPR